MTHGVGGHVAYTLRPAHKSLINPEPLVMGGGSEGHWGGGWLQGVGKGTQVGGREVSLQLGVIEGVAGTVAIARLRERVV
jgi:hypothetical protein